MLYFLNLFKQDSNTDSENMDFLIESEVIKDTFYIDLCIDSECVIL